MNMFSILLVALVSLALAAHCAEMEGYEWLRRNIGQRTNFISCPMALPTTSDEIQPSR